MTRTKPPLPDAETWRGVAWHHASSKRDEQKR
ncbi:MAG: DUF3470 domain-containing protein [Hydrogenophaga sp.]|nr:DUF3470 domain-containing protein [Hydrogenophaga sp.]